MIDDKENFIAVVHKISIGYFFIAVHKILKKITKNKANNFFHGQKVKLFFFVVSWNDIGNFSLL